MKDDSSMVSCMALVPGPTKMGMSSKAPLATEVQLEKQNSRPLTALFTRFSDTINLCFVCFYTWLRAIMVIMDLTESATRLGMMADDTKGSGPTAVSMVRGGLARPTAMFTKENSLLARQKARVCSRLRKVMFMRVSGSRGESGEKVCASGPTTENTRVTGREARSMDKDA